MRLLITGATGLVGKALVGLLQQNGVAVNYLSTSRQKISKDENFTGFYWNPENGEIDEQCLEGVEAVFHLAGASVSKRWTKDYKKEIMDSRVLSTQLLRDMLSRKVHQVKHFISASAIGIYPDSLNELYTEDNKQVDNSFLGEVVYKWEEAVQSIETPDIKVALVRTGLVLAKEGGALPQMAAPVKLGIGSAFGSGKQMQSWIHLDDLAGIYYFVLKNRLEGTYNAVAPNAVNNNELIHAIAKVLHKPYFMPAIPRFVLKAILGEMHMLLFTSQNVSADKIVGKGYQFKYPELYGALQNLLL